MAIAGTYEAVCVFCASSDAVDPVYVDAAKELGGLLPRVTPEIVYGGAALGLMREVAQAAREAGCRVCGVIPEMLVAAGIANEEADDLVVTEDMADRKAVMNSRSGAFVALPGGLGTLEELLEMMTLKQLGYHDKPIVVLNTAGFYDALGALLENLIAARFAKEDLRNLYILADSPEEAIHALERYEAPQLERKWF